MAELQIPRLILGAPCPENRDVYGTVFKLEILSGRRSLYYMSREHLVIKGRFSQQLSALYSGCSQ